MNLKGSHERRSAGAVQNVGQIVFGEIEINGHLPVTFPGVANFGFGINVPRR